MDYVFDIALVFAGAFAIGLIITVFLCFKFFPLVKNTDPELYQKLRFRAWSLFNKPYMNFIFKKEFQGYSNESVRKHALALYWVGWIAQWAFNIYLVLLIFVLVFR